MVFGFWPLFFVVVVVIVFVVVVVVVFVVVIDVIFVVVSFTCSYHLCCGSDALFICRGNCISLLQNVAS